MFDLDSGFRTVAPGFQKLWEAVARDLDIRLNHPVTAVRRRAKGQGWTIHVTSNGQTETFDRLITTVSHPRMLEVLDPSEAERAVYGRIRFNPYVTTVFRARGLAEGSTALLAQQCTPDRKGRLMMYSHPHPDRDLFLGWQYGLETDAPALSAAVFEDVAELGGEVLKIVHQEFWPDYFPHVEEEGLRAGHFEELQAMQGQRGTYYAGAMVDCELTGTVAAWAKKLVNTYFTNA